MANFNDWLAGKLGARLWVVAPRMTPDLAQHYELAVTRARFTALRTEFLAIQAHNAKRASERTALMFGNDRPWRIA